MNAVVEQALRARCDCHAGSQGDPCSHLYAAQMVVLGPENLEELGWAAGFFEGEGTLGVYKAPDGPRPFIAVYNADRSCLERFQDFVGLGSIVINRRPKPGVARKTVYTWHCQKGTDVQAVARLLYPHLSDRRAAKAREIFAWRSKLGSKRGAERSHCKNGHRIEAGSYRYNDRQFICLTCQKESNLRATERRRAARPPRQPKTHCVHGHEYTPENTYTSPDGRRQCRTCNHARAVEKAKQQKAARHAAKAHLRAAMEYAKDVAREQAA